MLEQKPSPTPLHHSCSKRPPYRCKHAGVNETACLTPPYQVTFRTNLPTILKRIQHLRLHPNLDCVHLHYSWYLPLCLVCFICIVVLHSINSTDLGMYCKRESLEHQWNLGTRLCMFQHHRIMVAACSIAIIDRPPTLAHQSA